MSLAGIKEVKGKWMVAFDRNRFWYKNYILKEMIQYQESYIIGKDKDK